MKAVRLAYPCLPLLGRPAIPEISLLVRADDFREPARILYFDVGI